MRICLISSSFYPAFSYGGPIFATWDLSQELAKKGIEVYVSTTNANVDSKLDVISNTFIKKSSNLFVKYYNEQIINRFSSSFVFGIWSDIKRSDLVYIQYLFHYTVFFSILFSFFLRKRIVICPRGSLSEWGLRYKHKWKKKIWINIFIRPFIRNVVWQASSYLEVDDIERMFKNSNIIEVTDGVDFDSFQNIERISKTELVNHFANKSFNYVSDVFFSMGRLHKIKGFEVIIEAFYLFIENSPNAKLLIAGNDDGFEEHIKQRIDHLGLSDSVFLIGAVNHEDKCKLLSNSSAFVLGSHFESFGIVIVEALSSGIPVIVSNKTPWKDIERNKCGIFTDNNKENFYNAFCRIKENKYDALIIRNFVKTNFNWEVIVNRFIKLIIS